MLRCLWGFPISEAKRLGPHPNAQALLAIQVRMLYDNTYLGAGVTVIVATALALLQRGTVSSASIGGWWLYMMVLAGLRCAAVVQYRQISPGADEPGNWRLWITLLCGMAGAGWGAAGVLLYPPSHLIHQVFLVFVLGGMMLGAASLLASRPEAYLGFLLPSGLVPAVRLAVQGDETHVVMGLLAALFTAATLITTQRIYRTIDSSLRLQFENRALVEDLRKAKNETEVLNQELEQRVRDRTLELQISTEQLRAEIQQREQIEEELLQARKLESLGVLAGGIAHDFNNFLTVIQGNLEMARGRLDVGHPVQAILDQIAAACQRGAFLASQLLTFAKGGSPVRRVVSMAKLVADAVHLARAGSAVTINLEVAEDLACAEVDPGQIGQVLHNVLLNARQSMPAGGIIEVHAENVPPGGPKARGRVRISIRDYGCGIPREVLPRIFDPYFTTRRGGSGLGLATSYAIVAKHNGHISVDSKPGAGTVVTIDLPASNQTLEPDIAYAPTMREGSERILVMDDEEGIRNLLHAVLSQLGYEIVAARDGAEAIALYEESRAAGRRFDAVLLDVTVTGGMGGVEAAAKLKEIDPAARLVVSSGYSDSPVLSEFAKYGFDAVIPKPWTASQLSEVIRNVLAILPDHKIE